MKKRLVDHIVAAVTERRAMVLVVTTVLCTLSIVSSIYLLESDMTFKGMIGKAAPPVRAYDKIIRDFEVFSTVASLSAQAE